MSKPDKHVRMDRTTRRAYLILCAIVNLALILLLALDARAGAEVFRTDAGDLLFHAPTVQARPRAAARPIAHPARRSAPSSAGMIELHPELAGKCEMTGDSIMYMVAATRVLPCHAVICSPAVSAREPRCTAKGAMPSSWVLAHVRSSPVAILSPGASNDILDWVRHRTIRITPALTAAHPLVSPTGAEIEKRQLLADPAATLAHLEAIRAKTGCTTCVWIKPFLLEPGAAVEKVAREHGDVLLTYAKSADGVHPRCPKCVAKDALAKLK